MKRIRFIRHGRLAEPYSDYSKLSFKQLSDLASRRISPNISNHNKELIMSNLLAKYQFDSILSSDSNRAIQTSNLVQKLSKKDVEINVNTSLGEVLFDPLRLTTEENFQKRGMDEIRKSLFRGMMKRQGAEGLSETFTRVCKLERLLLNYSYENILCITHSFLMRFLNLYFIDGIKDPKKIKLKAFMQTKDYSYIDGFTISL